MLHSHSYVKLPESILKLEEQGGTWVDATVIGMTIYGCSLQGKQSMQSPQILFSVSSVIHIYIYIYIYIFAHAIIS